MINPTSLIIIIIIIIIIIVISPLAMSQKYKCVNGLLSIFRKTIRLTMSTPRRGNVARRPSLDEMCHSLLGWDVVGIHETAVLFSILSMLLRQLILLL
jgi:hypothetical protein